MFKVGTIACNLTPVGEALVVLAPRGQQFLARQIGVGAAVLHAGPGAADEVGGADDVAVPAQPRRDPVVRGRRRSRRRT